MKNNAEQEDFLMTQIQMAEAIDKAFEELGKELNINIYPSSVENLHNSEGISYSVTQSKLVALKKAGVTKTMEDFINKTGEVQVILTYYQDYKISKIKQDLKEAVLQILDC